MSGVPVPQNEISFTTPAEGLIPPHSNISDLVCVSMLPVHGNFTPQDSPAPYRVTPVTLNLDTGGTVQGESNVPLFKTYPQDEKVRKYLIPRFETFVRLLIDRDPQFSRVAKNLRTQENCEEHIFQSN